MLTRRKTQHIASRQSTGKNGTCCMFGYVLWKSTNKTQVQATRHCSIYFLTHPAGVYIGVGTYYDHRCLLYQLAQRCQHPVCALPFTTTLISLGLIASAELLPFPSSDLGRNCYLSSLSELFFIVSSFNCKGPTPVRKTSTLAYKMIMISCDGLFRSAKMLDDTSVPKLPKWSNMPSWPVKNTSTLLSPRNMPSNAEVDLQLALQCWRQKNPCSFVLLASGRNYHHQHWRACYKLCTSAFTS